jgi:hypothetical protein
LTASCGIARCGVVGRDWRLNGVLGLPGRGATGGDVLCSWVAAVEGPEHEYDRETDRRDGNDNSVRNISPQAEVWPPRIFLGLFFLVPNGLRVPVQPFPLAAPQPAGACRTVRKEEAEHDDPDGYEEPE